MAVSKDFPFSHPVYGLGLSEETLTDIDETSFAVEWGPAEPATPLETRLHLVRVPVPSVPTDGEDGCGP
jgi:hypothetical protein